jgi:hypothetical protein
VAVFNVICFTFIIYGSSVFVLLFAQNAIAQPTKKASVVLAVFVLVLDFPAIIITITATTTFCFSNVCNG